LGFTIKISGTFYIKEASRIWDMDAFEMTFWLSYSYNQFTIIDHSQV